MAESARLEAQQPPMLYTLARDGALHSWVFLPDPEQQGAGAAEPAGKAEDAMEEDDAEAVVSAMQPAFTGGQPQTHRTIGIAYPPLL